ncbi:MAG: phage scaffolding protein [Clostridium sp.]|uniref:phage scaffolding protein n=1 Tax=Clostridium sp. TaxID=1506 RepID=UPI002909E4EF|nr:phage scaffolding protein [Clostridium sp.]MDU7338603.1 phage scaffolding protein [Clostridium sp.]
MKTEELTALGLSEEQATKVFEMHGKELTKLQNSVSTLTTERDGLKTQLGEANGKLAGYDPDWKTKADAAQQTAQKQLDALKFDYTLNDALKAAKVRDAVSVKAHLKTDAMRLDGESILGLKEQLETLKTEKGFLFESDEKPPIFSASTPGVKPGTDTGKDAANSALRELFGRKED